jgi:hypothetical protein
MSSNPVNLISDDDEQDIPIVVSNSNPSINSNSKRRARIMIDEDEDEQKPHISTTLNNSQSDVPSNSNSTPDNHHQSAAADSEDENLLQIHSNSSKAKKKARILDEESPGSESASDIHGMEEKYSSNPGKATTTSSGGGNSPSTRYSLRRRMDHDRTVNSNATLLAELAKKRSHAQQNKRRRLFQSQGGAATGEETKNSSIISQYAENNGTEEEFQDYSDDTNDFIVEDEENYSPVKKKPAKRNSKLNSSHTRPKTNAHRYKIAPIAQNGSENDHSESADDDFVVEDEEIEFVDPEDDRLAHIALNSARERKAHNSEIDYSALNNDELLEEISDNRVNYTDREAFDLWLRYLASSIIDFDFSRWVNSNNKAKKQYLPAISMIENQLDVKRKQWVHSELWEKAGRDNFRRNLCELPYLHTELLGQLDQELLQNKLFNCEACNRQHTATHKLHFFGISYNSESLKHPFSIEKLLYSEDYARTSFIVGELCHQRIKLYHR